MKKLLLTLLLPLFSQCLIGQNNSVLQFELGMGMNNSGFFKADDAQALSLNGMLKYQVKSVAFGLRYEQAITTLGIEGPTYYRSFIRARESEFSNYRSIQFRFDYSPNLESFQPILGIGFSKVFLDNKTKYYSSENLEEIENPEGVIEPEKRRFYSMVYYLGYRVKNIQYGITLTPAKGEDSGMIVGTGLSYSFGLTKRKSAAEFGMTMNHFWKLKPLMVRFEIGRSLLAPLKNDYAATARYFISGQVYIARNIYLGFTYEGKGTEMGVDRNTVHINYLSITERFYIRKTDISASISARKLYLHKFKSIRRNADFYYGGGIGVYKIATTGRSQILDYHYPPEFEETSNWGLLLSTGLRTGWFNNRLEINIPFGDIPAYVGLQTAIGIQWRRRNLEREHQN